MTRRVRFSDDFQDKQEQLAVSPPSSYDEARFLANVREGLGQALDRRDQYVSGALHAHERAREAMMIARSIQSNVRNRKDQPRIHDSPDGRAKHSEAVETMVSRTKETQGGDGHRSLQADINKVTDVVSVSVSWISDIFQVHQMQIK